MCVDHDQDVCLLCVSIVQLLPLLLRELAELLLHLSALGVPPRESLLELHDVLADSDDVTRKPFTVPFFQSLAFLCTMQAAAARRRSLGLPGRRQAAGKQPSRGGRTAQLQQKELDGGRSKPQVVAVNQEANDLFAKHSPAAVVKRVSGGGQGSVNSGVQDFREASAQLQLSRTSYRTTAEPITRYTEEPLTSQCDYADRASSTNTSPYEISRRHHLQIPAKPVL